MYFSSTNCLSAGIDYTKGTRKELTSSTAQSALGWTHYAITYDGAAFIMYVNGKVDKSASVTGASGDTSQHYLGKYANANATFVGYLDGAKLFNRALTPSEIEAVYNLAK